MANSKSRYKYLISGDKINSMPKINIKRRTTDKYFIYNSNKSRLDRMAAEVYGDDTLYWIILIANPQYFLEFDIPNNTAIRIPYPLQDVLQEFQENVIANQLS